ncbi:hypothetical protein MANES_01G268401v8 [Manihot esculenta]|uniref:Uncharacterized protein n=1 Tax=Manihot esculenta TaxID=3983 RepID=A0ACB7IIR5_MANES|nr:hypothetical protein MANES_01G268401v8 [Manihot esculenta]
MEKIKGLFKESYAYSRCCSTFRKSPFYPCIYASDLTPLTYTLRTLLQLSHLSNPWLPSSSICKLFDKNKKILQTLSVRSGEPTTQLCLSSVSFELFKPHHLLFTATHFPLFFAFLPP